MTPEELRVLECLSKLFSESKHMEEVYRRNRIIHEEAISERIPGPNKGQKTVQLPNGDKLTVKRDLSYKADCEALRNFLVNPECPPPVKSKTTWALDVAGYEWYRENKPEIFNHLATMVEVTPKKTAVTIKRKA